MSTEAKRAYDADRYRQKKAERPRSRDPILDLDEQTIAYLAGFTDGDGTIYATHTNRLKTYYPTIVWAVTDRPVLDWIAELLGSHTVQANNRAAVENGHKTWIKSKMKTQWKTGLTGRRAQLLCERMLPYLHIKCEQARLVCQFRDGRVAPGAHLPGEVRAERERLARAITALNRA